MTITDNTQRGWQPIETAPYREPVEVRVGDGMIFVARLIPDAAMTEGEVACDQWSAEHEGEHPPCWSGGACWESNEDEVASLQPTAWRSLSRDEGLRDWFAGQALAGYIAHLGGNGIHAGSYTDECTSEAYRLADAMLAARTPHSTEER